MELKDFVAESLLSIVEGIKDAQSKFPEHGAHINPGNLMRGTSSVAETPSGIIQTTIMHNLYLSILQ
jgi:hypothetical protein